jgi:hypothetical protein
MAAFYRYQLGGSGAPVGIMIVLLSALLGVLARQWWLRRTHPPRIIDYLALGVVVQLMQLAAITQIPNRAGYPFIEQAWWVLLLIYPLATMLLCQVFRNHEQQLIDQQAVLATQAEIERHRNHLEELVATRTAELAKALDAAEAASLGRTGGFRRSSPRRTSLRAASLAGGALHTAAKR